MITSLYCFADKTDLNLDISCSTNPDFGLFKYKGSAISTASESNILETTLNSCIAKVLPLEDKSTMASAKPRLGAISTEPLIVTIETLRLYLSKKIFADSGYEVATLKLFKSLTVFMFESLGTATTSEQKQ